MPGFAAPLDDPADADEPPEYDIDTDADEPPDLDDLVEPPEVDMCFEDEIDADIIIDDMSGDEEEFVEWDPSGRYARYAEILGKGAMKTVYKAYDLVDCKEVAWNKAIPLLECSEEQATAVQREVKLLKGLNFKGIIKLYGAWIDKESGDTNFITELCSSSLLAYRMKHKHVSRKALKSWARQILSGLAYLHSQNPPIIHRDLKCENIFVKCSANTALKIGDFGAATVLDQTHHLHTVVGTPEFMAPEMYNEDYNELVDVYSFGMCMLELLTRECPYSECNSIAQVYKKVTSGVKPKALLKVKDSQTLRFINRCLLPVSQRPSASELLCDAFLLCTESNHDFEKGGHTGNHCGSVNNMERSAVVNASFHAASLGSTCCDSKGGTHACTFQRVASSCSTARVVGDLDDQEVTTMENSQASTRGSPARMVLGNGSSDPERSYQVMGTMEDESVLRFKLRIRESGGKFHDIFFPFDLRSDTPDSVAEEMVRTLEYPDSDLVTIADLISLEISALTINGEPSAHRPIISELCVGQSQQQAKSDGPLLYDGAIDGNSTVDSLEMHGNEQLLQYPLNLHEFDEGRASAVLQRERSFCTSLHSSVGSNGDATFLWKQGERDGLFVNSKFCLQDAGSRVVPNIAEKELGCAESCQHLPLRQVDCRQVQLGDPSVAASVQGAENGAHDLKDESDCSSSHLDSQPFITTHSKCVCKHSPGELGVLLGPASVQASCQALHSHVGALA